MTTVPTLPRANRRRTRRCLVAAAALVASGSVAGCMDTGFGAQTDQIYQPGPGITVRHDGVFMLNAAIVSDGKGHGTLIGALLNKNRAPDQLRSVVVLSPQGSPLTVTFVKGPVTLPPFQSVQLADTGRVRISGTLSPGTFDKVRLRFRHGIPIATQLPVLPHTDEFAKVPVGPVTPPVRTGGGGGASS